MKYPFLADLSERLAQIAYGKSSKIDAPENQNSDFRSGFGAGLVAESGIESKEWEEAWFDYGSPNRETPEWVNWKRGFHAGAFMRIMSENK